jgi:hypothetical protein
MKERLRTIAGGAGAIGLALTVVWTPVASIYTFYAWITYTGLYRWLAEWHMEGTGRYSPTETLFDLLGLLIGPPVAVILLLNKLGVLPDEPAAQRTTVPAAKAPVSPAAAVPARCARTLERTVIGILVALAAIAVGSGSIWYEQSQEPTSYESVNLDDRRAPRSSNVELTGTVRADLIIEFEEEHEKYTYVPLTSADWRKGQPITYFVMLHYAAEPETLPATMTQKGLLNRNDLPGAVAAAFEKHGYVLASPTLVLDVGASSSDQYIYIALGSASLPAVALMFLLLGGLARIKSWIAGARRPTRG